MKRLAQLSVVLSVVLCLSGCAAVGPLLSSLALGAQWLSSAIDVADDGSRAYFARHPSTEQYRVAEAIANARRATSILNETLSAIDAGADRNLDRARRNAMQAYQDLYFLLLSMGILDAKPPAGGAETDAPKPQPFALPLPIDVARRL